MMVNASKAMERECNLFNVNRCLSVWTIRTSEALTHRNAGGAPRKREKHSSANSAMRAASRTSPAGMKPGL